ncbi:regulatory protein, LuxR [Alloactinosynnema sp. L-07]|uniref:helix-turn-helix transcriptional regulator n=1 Tax=Alloactinosynnema sp. L-07 TaxID=1653480 RepID=UPI00065F02E3|nr:LuxR family transcriptional regulator [Alloactinosynnema sp. L-07]CRK59479.1 regulatory protein, LuxR [Alloactinosynnema sp. L-07]
MALVERNEELRTLNRLFADCARNRGQVALISGGVASGKTELLHTFAEHAAGKGATVLTATGSRAEHSLAFGVLKQLASAQTLPEAVAANVASLLSGDTDAARPDPVSIGRSRALILEGLCAALMEAAKSTLVVLCVDDVQFADGPSLQAVLYLQRRMRFARVMIILTEWALPRPTRAVFRAEVTRQPNTTHLRLAPLSKRGVEDLLRAELDTSTARTLAPVHHALSGGNPLLATALIEDFRAATRAGGGREKEMAVGQAYGHAVISCLHRWEPAMLEVARGLALLGDAGTPALVGRLVDMTAEAAGSVLEVLELAGLLDGGRFRHPVAKAAVLHGLGKADRAARHLRAAWLLHHDGADAAQVADHLVAADQADGPWAVAVLRHAAQEAQVADRLDLAMARLDLAARSCSDETEHADIVTQLLRVEWRENSAAAERHLTPLLDARASGTLADHNAVHLAKFLLWYGHTEDLAGTLAGLAAAASKPDHPAAAYLGLVVRWLAFVTPGATERIKSMPLPSGKDDPWSRAGAVLDAIRAGKADSETARAAEYILQSCRLGEQAFGAQLSALAALIHADRIDRAATVCEALLAEATNRRAVTWQAVLGGLRGEIALRQGDLPAAAEYARVAADAVSAQGWGVVMGSVTAVRVAAATAMGDHQLAATLLRQPVPESVFQTQFGLQYLYARGAHYLATDRPHAALGDFQRCGELMARWSVDLPALAPWRVGAAQAQLALGNREAARTLVSEHLALPGCRGPRNRGIAMRILAATVDATRRVSILAESVDLLHAGGDRFELARALTDLSQAHQDSGACEKARAVARRALQMAKRCQAEPLSRDLRPAREAEPYPADAESLSMDVLSEAERRVAVLAALGHTNREIGGKLYITVSTVEQHLTRVYRKLKVTKRTDLPAGLPRQLMAEDR